MPVPKPMTRRPSRKTTFIKGVGSGGLYTLVTIVVGLWLAPFLLRYMSREEYGLFALANEVIMWLNLLDIGVSGALLAKAAQLSAEKNDDKLNILASTAFFAQLAEVGLVVGCGLFVVANFGGFFSVAGDLKRRATILAALLVLQSVVLLLTKTYSSLLIAYQQVHIDNFIKIVLIAIRTALVVILTTKGFGILSLGIGSVVSAAIAAVLSVWRVYYLLPWLSLRLRYVSWSSLKSVFRLGIWFSLANLAQLFVVKSSYIVTGKVLTVAMVTTLSLTGRLYLITGRVMFQINRALRPALGQIIGEGRREHSFTVFRQYLVFSLGMAALMLASIFAGNRHFVEWWVGEEYYAGTTTEVFILLNSFLIGWVFNWSVILSSDIQMKEQAYLQVFQGVAGVCLATFLGHRYGMSGVISGFVLAAVATSFWFLPILVCHRFDHEIRELLRSELPRIMIYLVVVWGFGFLARTIEWQANPLLVGVCKGAATGVFGLLVGWSILLNSDMRRQLSAFVATGVSRYRRSKKRLDDIA